MKIRHAASSAGCLLVVLVACGGQPSSTFGENGSSGSSGASGGSSGASGGSSGASGGSSGSSGASGGIGAGGDASTGGGNCDPNGGDQSGCACNGTTRACWTVNGSQRNANGCHDGTQTCTKQGEFSVWSPCVGEATSCAASAPDAGTDALLPPNCTCVPGAVRWCDTPVGCDWGKQPCQPDGTWGPCSETNDRPTGCNNSSDTSYDEACCLQAGQCCQDYEGDDEQKSKGNCAQIACPGDIVK